MEQRAMMKQVEKEQLLHAALSHKEDLPESHAALAAHYRRIHSNAEFDRDPIARMKAEIRLGHHVSALPPGHEARERYDSYLKGDGSLTFRSSPEGADIHLECYNSINRRLVATEVRSLGQSPLVNIPISMGSYRLRIEKPGFQTVFYPVRIDRQTHWNDEEYWVRLPPDGDLADDDCYVPGGWFWCGGDDKALNSLVACRRWLPSFIMKRHSVTHRQYIEFLDDLVRQGREAEALGYAPSPSESTEVLYGRTTAGGFRIVPDAQGDIWQLDWPVFLVDLISARAYARWFADRTGQPWRLPFELEWEKAAKGVDGRLFPWGDSFDESWASCWSDGELLPHPVDSFPYDTSPYGVRGMAGNMMNWTVSPYRKEGPPHDNGVVRDSIDESEEHWIVRGGAWCLYERNLRLSSRDPYPMEFRNAATGFRLCRSL
jgi:serine/threonine-protein kinase